jgi:hypothetical protein
MLATQGVRKPTAQKALEAHAAAGRLTSKTFGKATIYWRPQPEGGAEGGSAADVAAATARLAALNDELAAVNGVNARLARELAAAQAAPSPAALAERTAAAEAALPGLHARLEEVSAAKGGGAGAAANAPALDRAAVLADLARGVAAWAKHKRIFNAAWDAVSENLESGNVKSVMEEMGVVTDKAAGVELGDVRALLAQAQAGGGGGGGAGSVGKRGRA